VVQRTSYRKTILLASALAVVGLAAWLILRGLVPAGPLVTVLDVLAFVGVMAAVLVAAGGFVCLWRDSYVGRRDPEPVGASLHRVPGEGLLARLGLRGLLGPAPRPGDLVTVRPLEEIRAMLDDEASLDGLPFMPEMHRFCGGTFRVHRRVDKIYDMRHKTGMRRLRGAVTLTGLRCDGRDHGGCQAGCHLLWKDAWLRRVRRGFPSAVDPTTDTRSSGQTNGVEPDHYVCQMTRLWEATRAMSRFDLRQDLRPLFSGNVPLGTFLAVMLSRLFALVQARRGGMAFPYMPNTAASPPPRSDPERALAPGQRVAVEDRLQIAGTLINNRTRGLWYDQDMVRFCGDERLALRPVERIIHEATGKMIRMKTRSWILEDVTATGEFHRLCAQNEYLFWREAWLRPLPSPDRLEVSSLEMKT
jgi:hypothetical protein